MEEITIAGQESFSIGVGGGSGKSGKKFGGGKKSRGGVVEVVKKRKNVLIGGVLAVLVVGLIVVIGCSSGGSGGNGLKNGEFVAKSLGEAQGYDVMMLQESFGVQSGGQVLKEHFLKHDNKDAIEKYSASDDEGSPKKTLICSKFQQMHSKENAVFATFENSLKAMGFMAQVPSATPTHLWVDDAPESTKYKEAYKTVMRCDTAALFPASPEQSHNSVAVNFLREIALIGRVFVGVPDASVKPHVAVSAFLKTVADDKRTTYACSSKDSIAKGLAACKAGHAEASKKENTPFICDTIIAAMQDIECNIYIRALHFPMSALSTAFYPEKETCFSSSALHFSDSNKEPEKKHVSLDIYRTHPELAEFIVRQVFAEAVEKSVPIDEYDYETRTDQILHSLDPTYCPPVPAAPPATPPAAAEGASAEGAAAAAATPAPAAAESMWKGEPDAIKKNKNRFLSNAWRTMVALSQLNCAKLFEHHSNFCIANVQKNTTLPLEADARSKKVESMKAALPQSILNYTKFITASVYPWMTYARRPVYAIVRPITDETSLLDFEKLTNIPSNVSFEPFELSKIVKDTKNTVLLNSAFVFHSPKSVASYNEFIHDSFQAIPDAITPTTLPILHDSTFSQLALNSDLPTHISGLGTFFPVPSESTTLTSFRLIHPDSATPVFNFPSSVLFISKVAYKKDGSPNMPLHIPSYFATFKETLHAQLPFDQTDETAVPNLALCNPYINHLAAITQAASLSLRPHIFYFIDLEKQFPIDTSITEKADKEKHLKDQLAKIAALIHNILQSFSQHHHKTKFLHLCISSASYSQAEISSAHSAYSKFITAAKKKAAAAATAASA